MIYNQLYSLINDQILAYKNKREYGKISEITKNNEKFLLKNNPLVSIYIPTYNRRKGFYKLDQYLLYLNKLIRILN